MIDMVGVATGDGHKIKVVTQLINQSLFHPNAGVALIGRFAGHLALFKLMAGNKKMANKPATKEPLNKLFFILTPPLKMNGDPNPANPDLGNNTLCLTSFMIKQQPLPAIADLYEFPIL